jgi:hypothetical protein
MNELKRLRTTRGNPTLTRLLEAGHAERPSASALQRTLVAVGGAGALLSAGVGAAAATTSKAAASSSVATLTAGSAAPTAVASGSAISAASGGASGAGLGATIGATTATLKLVIGPTALAVGKWTILGAVGLGVASQVPEWTNDAGERPKPAGTTVELGTVDDSAFPPSQEAKPDPRDLVPQGEHPSAVVNTVNDPLPAATQPLAATSASVEEIPRRGALSAASPLSVGDSELTGQRNPENRVPPGRSPEGAPSPEGASSDAEALAAEISLVDQARTLTRSGSAREALSVLAGYERTFPQQQLLVEVVVLRMEAEYALGRGDRAAAFANRVLGIPSGAPHRTRAREILRLTQP